MTDRAMTRSDQRLPAVATRTAPEEILGSDILIPRLYLMQGMSLMVMDGETGAKPGEFRRSTTKEVVGGLKQPIQFIPLTFRNRWMKHEVVGEQKEYRGTEARRAANEDLPWEYEEEGRQFFRTKVVEVFALLPADVAEEEKALKALKDDELPDLSKSLMPIVISFRSTGFKAGQVVVSHFAQARQISERIGREIKPYDYMLELSCRQEKKDKNIYYVPDVKVLDKKTAPIDDHTKEVVYHWAGFLSKAADEVLTSAVDDRLEGEAAAPQRTVAVGGGSGEDKF